MQLTIRNFSLLPFTMLLNL